MHMDAIPYVQRTRRTVLYTTDVSTHKVDYIVVNSVTTSRISGYALLYPA